ncbi:MAG TPA: hypothetical protein PKE23_07820, partial [Anaerolineales bacterium]|nr:hypothetical protein [Anaerolineales bacterium]
IMDEYRIACLEMMGLKSDQVTSVRGVVIIGRDKGNDHEHLRKIKATDFGRKLFMTYDDFIQGLEILIREMKGL